jgi:hypothetical protein
MDWATFWAIFFTNSSGHTVPEPLNLGLSLAVAIIFYT